MITTSGRPIAPAINDVTMAGEARRAATALAGRLGFNETERGKVAIVATEAATNLSKHAKGGEIVIQGLEFGTIGGVDILTLDRGPGMADVDRCRTNGYSTAGSQGAGLGGWPASRNFDLHSLPGIGTATLASLWAEPRPERLSPSAWISGLDAFPWPLRKFAGHSWRLTRSKDGPSSSWWTGWARPAGRGSRLGGRPGVS